MFQEESCGAAVSTVPLGCVTTTEGVNQVRLAVSKRHHYMFREIVDTFMQLLCHLGDVPHVPQLVGLDVRQQAVPDLLVGGAGGRPVAHHLGARIVYKFRIFI